MYVIILDQKPIAIRNSLDNTISRIKELATIHNISQQNFTIIRVIDHDDIKPNLTQQIVNIINHE